jgi:anti-sigma regulatory factor (Ser/Thr protein kinase)
VSWHVSTVGTPDETTRVTWHLEPDTAMVADARRRTTEALTSWGCDGLIADAQLVITELVTNAIVHAESACTVTLQLDDRSLHIEVTDDDPTPPKPQPFDVMREGGRGLLIVATLASAWGIEPQARGKRVWAQLA